MTINRFIYVFDPKTRNKLIDEGYSLLKSDERNCIYVFENKASQSGTKFSLEDSELRFVLSNVLSF